MNIVIRGNKRKLMKINRDSNDRTLYKKSSGRKRTSVNFIISSDQGNTLTAYC